MALSKPRQGSTAIRCLRPTARPDSLSSPWIKCPSSCYAPSALAAAGGSPHPAPGPATQAGRLPAYGCSLPCSWRPFPCRLQATLDTYQQQHTAQPPAPAPPAQVTALPTVPRSVAANECSEPQATLSTLSPCGEGRTGSTHKAITNTRQRPNLNPHAGRDSAHG